MEIITIAQARAQCASDTADDAQVTLYGNAAETRAQQWLNRKVFTTASVMLVAKGNVPAMLQQAQEDFEAAQEAASALEGAARAIALDAARADLAAVQVEAREILAGIVATDDIRAGILLILGHLFANREAVVAGQGAAAVQLPMGAYDFLWPYRIGLGI